MSASGNSSNLIPVVHCMLFFHCHFIVFWFKKKKVQYLISVLKQRWVL